MVSVNEGPVPSEEPSEMKLIRDQRQKIALAISEMVAEAARHFINVTGGLEVLPATKDANDPCGCRPFVGRQAYPVSFQRESLVSVRAGGRGVILTYYGFSAPIEFSGGYPYPAIVLEPKSHFSMGTSGTPASEKMGQLLSELHAQINRPSCKIGDIITVSIDPAFPVPVYHLYKRCVDLGKEYDAAVKARNRIRQDLSPLTMRESDTLRYDQLKKELQEVNSLVNSLDAQIEKAHAEYVG